MDSINSIKNTKEDFFKYLDLNLLMMEYQDIDVWNV